MTPGTFVLLLSMLVANEDSGCGAFRRVPEESIRAPRGYAVLVTSDDITDRAVGSEFKPVLRETALKRGYLLEDLYLTDPRLTVIKIDIRSYLGPPPTRQCVTTIDSNISGKDFSSPTRTDLVIPMAGCDRKRVGEVMMEHLDLYLGVIVSICEGRVS